MCVCVLCVHAKSLQNCPTLGHPVDCSLPGSSVLGIFQAKTLEWVAMPSSRGIFPTPRVRIQVPCIAGRFFTIWATREAPSRGSYGQNMGSSRWNGWLGILPTAFRRVVWESSHCSTGSWDGSKWHNGSSFFMIPVLLDLLKEILTTIFPVVFPESWKPLIPCIKPLPIWNTWSAVFLMVPWQIIIGPSPQASRKL